MNILKNAIDKVNMKFKEIFCKHDYGPYYDLNGNFDAKNNKMKCFCEKCGKQKYLDLKKCKDWIDLQDSFRFGDRISHEKQKYSDIFEYFCSCEKCFIQKKDKQKDETISDYSEQNKNKLFEEEEVENILKEAEKQII